MTPPNSLTDWVAHATFTVSKSLLVAFLLISNLELRGRRKIKTFQTVLCFLEDKKPTNKEKTMKKISLFLGAIAWGEVLFSFALLVRATQFLIDEELGESGDYTVYAFKTTAVAVATTVVALIYHKLHRRRAG